MTLVLGVIILVLCFACRTKSNFSPIEQAACEAGLAMGDESNQKGQGDAHSDDTVLISVAEMDGQVVSEVEISVAGNADEDNTEPDVNEAYAYKEKKKGSDNFE